MSLSDWLSDNWRLEEKLNWRGKLMELISLFCLFGRSLLLEDKCHVQSPKNPSSSSNWQRMCFVPTRVEQSSNNQEPKTKKKAIEIQGVSSKISSELFYSFKWKSTYPSEANCLPVPVAVFKKISDKKLREWVYGNPILLSLWISVKCSFANP